MLHFIGTIKLSNSLYLRLFNDSSQVIEDWEYEQVRSALFNGSKFIKNIGINGQCNIVGTCGKIGGYGILSEVEQENKNRGVILFKKNNMFYGVDTYGKKFAFNEVEAVIYDQVLGFANAKTVTRNGKSFICAKQGTFETGRRESEQLSEKLNKYKALDSEGKLGKSLVKKLDEADIEFELRKRGLIRAENSRLLDGRDTLFMRPITSRLNRIEKVKEKDIIERRRNTCKEKIHKIKKYIDIARKKGKLGNNEVTNLTDRLYLIKRDLSDAYKLHNDEDKSQYYDMSIMLNRINLRCDLLLDDIINRYVQIQ